MAAKKFHYIALVLILLLGAFLRFHDLDAQSFWYDEGNSARIIERTPRLIVEAAAGDIHPPGYYLALAGWRLLTGFSEFSLRSFSVFWGLLTIALTYALGTRMLNRSAGLVGAVIVTVHAFQVYYSQEARMYGMLAGIAAASMYAYVRWLNAQEISYLSRSGIAPQRATGRMWAAAWMLFNALGLYTQYAYPAVMLVQGITFVVWWLQHRSRGVLARYVVLNLVTIALFLPWLPVAIRQISTWPMSEVNISLGEMLGRVLALLAWGDAIGSAMMSGLLALLAASLWISMRRDAWQTGILWLWALLPAAIMIGLQLYRESFLKALLISNVPFVLLMVWAFELENRKRIRWILQLLIVGVIALGLVGLYRSENYRADYRAIARYVEANSGPTDAVLLNAANQWEVYTYYHREGIPVYPLPRTRPVDAGAVRAELDDILSKHDRLYVLYWGDAESDPEHIVENYLDTHAFEVNSKWYKDVRFVVYAVPPSGEIERVEIDARFGETMRLTGYALNAPEPSEPGDAVSLSLFWQAEDTPEHRYKVFVHLVDEHGDIIAQHDAEPDPVRPTNIWQANEQVTDNHGLLIPANAAPGLYQIAVGLYPIEDPLARLPLILDGTPAGDMLPLVTITVE